MLHVYVAITKSTCFHISSLLSDFPHQIVVFSNHTPTLRSCQPAVAFIYTNLNDVDEVNSAPKNRHTVAS